MTVNRLLRLFQYLQKKFRKLSGAEEKGMKLFPEILVAVPVVATVLATAYVVYRNGVQPFPEKDLLSWIVVILGLLALEEIVERFTTLTSIER